MTRDVKDGSVLTASSQQRLSSWSGRHAHGMLRAAAGCAGPAFIGFCTVLMAASAAWAAGGGSHGPGDLHVNWWTWDAHAPPVGWFIIDFLVFIGLLVHFTKKPVKQAFAQRHRTIKTAIAEAGATLDEARARHDEYRSKVAGVEDEAAQLVTSGKEDGERERGRIVEEAQDYVGRLQKDNSSVMAQEEERARERLRAETVREALVLAERTLREKLTDDDRQRLLEESIASLETEGDPKAAAQSSIVRTSSSEPPSELSPSPSSSSPPSSPSSLASAPASSASQQGKTSEPKAARSGASGGRKPRREAGGAP